MSNTGSTDNFGYSQELKRELSFKDVFVYGMLFMVVIAPMSIYGYISKDSHMMAPFVYFVGICAMFFTALSYMKMSNRFPIAGSVYAYVQRGLNRLAHTAGLCVRSRPALPADRQLVCGTFSGHAPLAVGHRVRGHQYPHQRPRHHLYRACRLDHVLCGSRGPGPVHRLRPQLCPW